MCVPPCAPALQIDEYLSTGTLADLSGAAGGAGAGKAADAERAMAANFLD